MIEGLPSYVSIAFIITTFVTAGFLIHAIKRAGRVSVPGNIGIALLFFWLVFTAVLGLGGFYQVTDVIPPRVVLFGVAPFVLVILLYLIFFRDLIERLPLRVLTWLHVIRVPVEIVLFWLFTAGFVPESMTFEGRNFDILSGLTAPFAVWLGFRGGKVNRTLLIIWNVAALVLLINIVATAIMAFPGPIQQIDFDQPNRGVLYFPFVWLPAIVVPIVLLSHLAALWKLAAGKTK